MAVFVVCLVILLAMAGHSDANYCICNSGLSNAVLQKSLDYACGNGADCSAILPNGPCFNPDTIKDHCNYAVNSYYQRKGQVPGSCDFSSTATVNPNAPNAVSGCVYQSSPSNGSSTSPPSNPTIGGTPPNANGSTPGTPGTVPVFSIPPPVSFVPPGNGFSNGTSVTTTTSMLVSFFLTFLIAGLTCPRI